MNQLNISQDDITDVRELKDRLESAFSEICSEHQHNLAMSALMSATINSISKHSKDTTEIFQLFDIFTQMIVTCLKEVNKKLKEEQ